MLTHTFYTFIQPSQQHWWSARSIVCSLLREHPGTFSRNETHHRRHSTTEMNYRVLYDLPGDPFSLWARRWGWYHLVPRYVITRKTADVIDIRGRCWAISLVSRQHAQIISSDSHHNAVQSLPGQWEPAVGLVTSLSAVPSPWFCHLYTKIYDVCVFGTMM
jgi:hypothetical protein